MSIFGEPPTLQQVSIAMQFPPERIEKSMSELAEVTLVTENTQVSDGRKRYVALPITLIFSGHRLSDMGEFEIVCRRRYQQFCEQMKLQDSEIFKFRNNFERYGLSTDNEKRAAILCQRGQSEMFIGNIENADAQYKEAREIAPFSAYVFAMSASYALARNRVGDALNYVNEACRLATAKTGALSYTIRAHVLDMQRDRYGRVDALAKALEFDPDDNVLRHQYGVALSRAGRSENAIEQFDKIIETERAKVPPTNQLLVAMKTRMINLRRLNRLTALGDDLEFVRKLISDNPHLASEAAVFEEFADSSTS
jgi:tetratricopeptide (TPR) repeat protein